MTRWLASYLIIGVFVTPMAATSATIEQRLIPDPESVGHTLNFRLIEEPKIGPRPIHNSGMLAQTEVAPNAAIGIGLFKSSQRKPDAGEFRLEGRSPNSRKAAVRFLFRF